MVIVNEDKNLIIATRGDTIILNINIQDALGNPYTPDLENDVLRFALKKHYNDDEPLLVKQIPLDTCQLRIDSAESKHLIQPGEYVYDIELQYGDGIVSTIIPNKDARVAKLKILEEVY